MSNLLTLSGGMNNLAVNSLNFASTFITKHDNYADAGHQSR